MNKKDLYIINVKVFLGDINYKPKNNIFNF